MATISWFNNMEVGAGWDSTTGTIHRAAMATPAELHTQGLGQTGEWQLVSIESSNELHSALDISVTASAAWAGISGSAEFSLAKSSAISTYHTYGLLTYRITNPAEKVSAAPALSEEAAATLAGVDGLNRFYSIYGHEAIVGRVTGACFYGLIDVETRSSQEKETIKAAIKAHHVVGDITASMMSDLETLTKDMAVSVKVTYAGGKGKVIETDLAGMVKEASTWSQVAATEPVVVAAITAYYKDMFGVEAINDPEVALQSQALTALATRLHMLQDYQASAMLASAKPEFTDDYRALQTDDARQAFRVKWASEAQAAAHDCALLNDCVVTITNDKHEYNQADLLFASGKLTCSPQTLPAIGGESMRIVDMENKLAELESRLGPDANPAALSHDLVVSQDLVVGHGGNARLHTRHIDGKRWDNDAPDSLNLNWDNGCPVAVGGAQSAPLAVHGDVSIDGNLHARGSVASVVDIATQVVDLWNGDDGGGNTTTVTFGGPWVGTPSVCAMMSGFMAFGPKGNWNYGVLNDVNAVVPATWVVIEGSQIDYSGNLIVTLGSYCAEHGPRGNSADNGIKCTVLVIGRRPG